MADKRIQDFATLAEAADDDLILVSSSGETYNIKVSTLKAAVSAALKSTLDSLSTGKADKSTSGSEFQELCQGHQHRAGW